MPFQQGKRLPGERASKIGHLEVLKNPLVNSLCEKLKDEKGDNKETASQWTSISSTIHETLMLFTGIRYFWEKKRELLSDCLFIKDGPLSIRAQYSKLVAPIRNFLTFAIGARTPVHIVGQEKTGTFVEHLFLLRDHAPFPSYFIPNDAYIKERIQHRPNQGAPYGKDTNYGAKIFLKLNAYHSMVINVPTGQHVPDPAVANLIGFDRVVATLPSLLSNRYEGALMPIELANGVASLSTYPSAQILKMFAKHAGSGI